MGKSIRNAHLKTAETLDMEVGQWIFFVLNENMISQKNMSTTT